MNVILTEIIFHCIHPPPCVHVFQVMVRLHNGSPAPRVQVEIQNPVANPQSKTATTNSEGAANAFFSFPDNTPTAKITVSEQNFYFSPKNRKMQCIFSQSFSCPFSLSVYQAKVDGHTYEMTALPASSPSRSFLFITMNSDILTPGEGISADIDFIPVGGAPVDGHIYYLVRSIGA